MRCEIRCSRSSGIGVQLRRNTQSINLSPLISVIGDAPGSNAAFFVPLEKSPVVMMLPRTVPKRCKDPRNASSTFL